MFDTETSVDPSQRLIFGNYVFGVYEDGRFIPCQEGLFFADDLPTTDPDGYRLLKDYVRSHKPRIEPGYVGTAVVDEQLRLMPRSRFMTRLFYEAAAGAHLDDGEVPVTIIGFNLPFDMARIAHQVGEARG